MRVFLLDDHSYMLDIIQKETQKILAERGSRADFDSFRDFPDDCDLSGYDLFILDIELRNKESGFDVAKRITKQNPDAIIMFCTVHDNLVFSSFSLNTFYFVRKNHLNADLCKAMDKYMEQVALKKLEYHFHQSDITVKAMSIKYIIGIGTWATFHIKGNKEMMERQPLFSIMEQLPAKLFAQIDRNVIVNVSYIEDLDHNKILMKDGKEFRISRRRIGEVVSRYARYENE